MAQPSKEGSSPSSGLLPILPGKGQTDERSGDKPPLPRTVAKKPNQVRPQTLFLVPSLLFTEAHAPAAKLTDLHVTTNGHADVQGKAVSEISREIQRRKEKRRDGSLTWETAPPLEVPQVT